MDIADKRLIEAGFPCHQVGAETQRERGASSALPPLYFLHVWWARRPLTPSRAAIVASLDPADTDPETFVRQLGIEKVQALVEEEPWTLTGPLLGKLESHDGKEYLRVDKTVLRSLEKEQMRRADNRETIAELKSNGHELSRNPVLLRWEAESSRLPSTVYAEDDLLPVIRTMGDPAHVQERIQFAKSAAVKDVLERELKWDAEDLYGYGRAFTNQHPPVPSGLTVLDPTAGGGSIPFEALRLGHNVIANELNPVASTILYATLDFPARFGMSLVEDIELWGRKLLDHVEIKMDGLAPFSPIPETERAKLQKHLAKCPELLPQYDTEYDFTGFIYARQVICPHCMSEAPLLSTSWLSKEAGDPWGVKIITDGKERDGKVHFETYRITKGKGPEGEDPDFATVNRGTGLCIHCRQAIDGDEIKAQARGESALGKWQDRLYAIVAVRLQPKLDKNGKPQYFKTGERAGEIKTEKVRYFRAPNERDLAALTAAEQRLAEKWDEWESAGLIPTEFLPPGSKTSEPLRYGMPRFCDMFTPRQLLGHLTLAEGLNRLKPQILAELGPERGRAVATYLQFAIDKGVDYNSRQTRWITQRCQVSGTFGRHDFSLKWTFGEMIFTGPNSGSAWGLSQVLDAYKGIADLVTPLNRQNVQQIPLQILNGTAAHLPDLQPESVDLVCMDPPYYDNVQYSELSDFYYVWQKRGLKDLYPEIHWTRITNKSNEAVANPTRDGSRLKAKRTYEKKMQQIFAECRRVVKNNGLLTIMFTHKSQDAWETLTRSLIDAGWVITASFPVESEFGNSMHQKDLAAAASSIFIACRKRREEQSLPAVWTGLGGSGVQQRIREEVTRSLGEFKPLRLNPVDQMVACYGRALYVLSEQWPVMDGDEVVGPIRAMSEASRVVAENQISELTKGRLSVDDLDPETGMALTTYGIWGLNEFSFDEALNLSRSLNIALTGKAAGYRVEGRMIGINQQAGGRGRTKGSGAEENGYHAPLIRSGSKLRLAHPEERSTKRLSAPQTDWDLLHGLVMNYRKGDIPVARDYLDKNAKGKEHRVLDLLKVWAAEMDDKNLRREGEAILFGLK